MAIKLGTLLYEFGANTSKLKTAQKEIINTNKKVTKSFSGLQRAITAAISLESARRILMLADNMVMLRGRIDNMTRSQKESNKVLAELVRISNEVGTSIDGTVKSFQRFNLTKDIIGASTDEILRFNETILKLGLVSGATATEITATSVQIGQAMSGNFESAAQEINSINEQLPEVARAVERNLGLVSGSFKREFEGGKRTSKEFFDAIIKASDEADKRAAALPKTIARASQEFANNFAVIVDEINSAAGATQSLSDAIGGMADALKEMNVTGDAVEGVFSGIRTILLSVFAIVAGRGVASFSVLTKKKIELIAATRQLEIAEIAEARSSNISALLRQKNAALLLASAKTTDLRSAAITRMAIANTAAIASQERLNLAIARGSVVARLSTGVMLKLKGVLAFFGGPIGVATIAAIAMSDWVFQVIRGKKETKTLNEEVAALVGNFKRLERAKLESKLKEVEKALSDLRLEAQKIEFAPTKQISQVEKLYDFLTKNESELQIARRSANKEQVEKLEEINAKIRQQITNAELLKAAISNLDEDEKEPGKSTAVKPEVVSETNKLLAAMGDETQAMLNELQARNIKIKELQDIGEKERQDLFNKSSKIYLDQVRDRVLKEKAIAIAGAQQIGGKLTDLMRSTGKEQSAIGKALFLANQALQVASIIVNTQAAAAAASVTASAAGPLGYFSTKAGILASGYASAGLTAGIGIAETFEHGGIVGGNSFSGDNIPARLNSGEMVFNKGQQSKLFSMVNGGGQGGRPNITLINNGTPQKIDNTTVTQDDLQIAMSDAVDTAVKQVGVSLSRGQGRTFRALQAGTKIERNIR